MRSWTGWLLAVICMFSLHAAGEAQKITFQSRFDTFTLTLTSPHRGTVDGKRADLSALKDLLPALLGPITNECSGLGRHPDLTVTVNGKKRFVYVKDGLISEGHNCINVGGDGLYYLPLHRDFLIGEKRESIVLMSPLKIFRQGTKLLSLKKEDGEWQNEDPNQLLNWDFLDRFENSLKDFSISLRLQEGIAKNKSKMIVQSGGKTYAFFKITNVMWAVKRPGMHWLEASNDWSFWYDFDKSILDDRYADQIHIAGDRTHSKEERMQALDKIGQTWSPNLRALYHKIVLTRDEDPDIQELAIQRLKRKPALETAGVMLKFLEQSTNEDLKREAGIILKLQNPKGPKYDPNASESEKEKTLEFWRTWWRQKHHTS